MKIAKSNFIILSLCLYFHSFTPSAFSKSRVPPDQSQVTVENVFIPERGFDNNDNVQMVLDGKLPGICYDLGETVVKRNPTGSGFTITQFARKRSVLGCGTSPGGDGEGFLNFPVQYQKEVSLGRLAEGQYTLFFTNETGGIGKRQFMVEKTRVINHIDEQLYAPITSAFIPEMIYETENGEAILSGILSSTCLKLIPEKIKVERLKDVIVVLPQLMVDQLPDCTHSPRPINEIISLGDLRPGRYLLHVRSMTGVSINKVFSVLKKREVERRR